jgi:hypothetical protein
MVTDIPGAKLEEKDKSEKKGFMVAHHFLWTYQKNANLLSSHFGISERGSRGDPVWSWIARIAALNAVKIVKDTSATDIFIMTLDGTDFRMWETKHPTLNQNPQMCSKKFNHAAVKYEIGLSPYRNQIMWLKGPVNGGKHDMTLFRCELKGKLNEEVPERRLVISDRGYATSRADEGMLAIPNATDSRELNNFKSRAQLRQETLNGRAPQFFSMLVGYFSPWSCQAQDCS